MRGGALWLEREAWPEPLDGRVRRAARPRRRAARSSAPSTTSSWASARWWSSSCARARASAWSPTCSWRTRHARWAWARRSSTPCGALPAPRRASASTPARCRATARPRTSSRPTGSPPGPSPCTMHLTPSTRRAVGGRRPEVAVGAVCTHLDALLLIRRGRGAAQGQWSVPGGRVEWGETLHEAVVRETLEETGLEVVVDRYLGWVERIHDPYHYVIIDFAVTVLDPSHDHRSRATTPPRWSWVPFADVSDLRPRRRALRVPARHGPSSTWLPGPMDFDFTAEDEAFRTELRAFLDDELPEWWKTVFVDDARAMPFTREFCHQLAARGWLTLSWPRRARRRRRIGVAAGRRARGDVGGGRAARPAVHEPQLHRPADHALRNARAAGAPPAAHGRGRRASGARASPSPRRAPTSRRSRPAPCATATATS